MEPARQADIRRHLEDLLTSSPDLRKCRITKFVALNGPGEPLEVSLIHEGTRRSEFVFTGISVLPTGERLEPRKVAEMIWLDIFEAI